MYKKIFTVALFIAMLATVVYATVVVKRSAAVPAPTHTIFLQKTPPAPKATVAPVPTSTLANPKIADPTHLFYVADNSLYSISGIETKGTLLASSFLDSSGYSFEPVRYLIGFPPAISADGRYAVFVGSHTTLGIDVTTGHTRTLAESRVTVSLSPNGERGAFVNFGGLDVFYTGRDAAPERIVSDIDLVSMLISWSPQDRYIAFVRYKPTPSTEMAHAMLFDWKDRTVREIGQLRMLGMEIAPSDMRWSADGSTIYVLRQAFTVEPGHEPALPATPWSTGAKIEITGTVGNSNGWSVMHQAYANDAEIILSYQDGFRSDIYLQSRTDGSVKKLAPLSFTGGVLVGWKVLGEEIVVSGLQPELGKYQMVVINVKSKQVKPFLDNALLMAVVNEKQKYPLMR